MIFRFIMFKLQYIKEKEIFQWIWIMEMGILFVKEKVYELNEIFYQKLYNGEYVV